MVEERGFGSVVSVREMMVVQITSWHNFDGFGDETNRGNGINNICCTKFIRRMVFQWMSPWSNSRNGIGKNEKRGRRSSRILLRRFD